MKFIINAITKKDTLADYEITNEEIIIKFYDVLPEHSDEPYSIKAVCKIPRAELTDYTYKYLYTSKNTQTEYDGRYLQLHWENVNVSIIIETQDEIMLCLPDSKDTITLNKKYFEINMEMGFE